ncbi:hypothetical protein Q7P37_010152 [Cladosporium fusiforme]
MLPSVGTAGRGRGRGRGSNNTARGASNNARGRGFSSARGGHSNATATFGQPTRGNTSGSARGGNGTPRANGFTKPSSRGARGASSPMAQTQGSWQQRFDKLEAHRKRERTDAIAKGIIADPDKPRALSQALTPTATCMDMCPEFERVQRVTQNDVWVEEKDMSQPGVSFKDASPDETKMVKKFRRAAAGIEEQLPSDLRRPHVLSQTCDYLFNEVVANAPELGRVHHFVWDRTRAIRNDFTILQVSSPEDLICAVDCLERIARFHIVSLHQMAGVKDKDFQYDWQQDREQLDRTLVSLMQYYDDSRSKIPLPNEPEFRAYLIVFQLQDPDMEDRVQSWPQELVQHPRIRKALKLYAAAGTASSLHGPLRPPATIPIAQQNWQRFWNLVASNRTSYMTACVAEINFNFVRRMALQALTKSVNLRATADFTTEELCEILAFDDGYEVEAFLESYNVTFEDREEGRFADIAALKSRHVLPEPSPAPPRQYKSEMVEVKRFGRTLPAVISGFSFKEAQINGMVNEEEIMFNDENMEDMAEAQGTGNAQEDGEPFNDGESLFLPDTAKPKAQSTQTGFDFDATPSSMFGQAPEQPKQSPFGFGNPSTGTFGAASGGNQGIFAGAKTETSTTEKPKSFNFLGGGSTSTDTTSAFNPTPNTASNGFLGSNKPASPASAQSPFGGTSFGEGTKKEPSSSPFGGFQAAPKSDTPSNPESSKSLFSGFPSLPKDTNTTKPESGNSPFGGFQSLSKDNNASKPEPAVPSSLFSQPAKPSGSPKPFIEENDNDETSPGSSPQLGNNPPAPFTPATDKPALPSFSIANPASSESQTSKAPSAPFASFGKPAEGATQQSAAPSTSPDKVTTTSLPDFAPPPKPAATPSFSFTGSKDSTASARRGSASDNFNRPAHPSPLAQSFTAGVDATENVSAEPPAPSNPVLKQPPAPPQSKPAEPKKPEPKPEPELDFASIISDIARDVTLFPNTGLFDQYIDFYVNQVVTDVQEQLHFERVNAQADEFRLSVLSHRYGKLWRDLCRRKRLARQGRERRRRTQQRLLESRSQASETASVADSVSVLGRSQVGGTMGTKLSRQEEVDNMFQQSLSSGRWSRKARQDDQARGGSKRPTSSLSADSQAGSRETGHKRLKSTSHVDDSGRITKPAPTSHPSNGALKRSSFREALPDNPPVASTTKSNYFRLKALGKAHIYDFAPTHPRKRPHAEVADFPASTSQFKASRTSPQQTSPGATPMSFRARQPSTSSVRSRKITEEDDALFARARAAREALRDGGGLTQQDAENTDPLRLSTGSQAIYESPSLERARMDARLRASQSGTDFGSSRRSDVPAYRLRESKFVPREHYSKAIDRAREMRSSRSGNTSRPESRIDMQTPSKPAETTSNNQAQSSFTNLSPLVGDNNAASTPMGQSQPHWPTAAPSHISPNEAAFDNATNDFGILESQPFGATNAQAQPYGFENHTFQNSAMSGFDNRTFQQLKMMETAHCFTTQYTAPSTNTSYRTGFARDSNMNDVAHVPANTNVENVDDSDDEVQITNVTTPYANGTSAGHTTSGQESELVSDNEGEEDDSQGVQGHANPYAALANGVDDDDEEEEEELSEDDDGRVGTYPGAYGYGEYDDGDDEIEDEDGEGMEFEEDEEDFDDDEEDEEEDDGDQYLDPSIADAHNPTPNPAFATQATTEEVIELSD